MSAGVRDRRKRPVIRSDGKRYASQADAALDVLGDQTNISRACREPFRTAYGYGWAFDDERDGRDGD